MPKLYASAGRNELALPQQRLVELVESRNGLIPEKELLRLTGRDLQPAEQFSIIKHLCDTDQLYKIAFKWPDDKAPLRVWIITPEAGKREEVLKAVRASRT